MFLVNDNDDDDDTVGVGMKLLNIKISEFPVCVNSVRSFYQMILNYEYLYRRVLSSGI
jgi:hypothetical protein